MVLEAFYTCTTRILGTGRGEMAPPKETHDFGGADGYRNHHQDHTARWGDPLEGTGGRGVDPGSGKRRQMMKSFATKKEADTWLRDQQRRADRGEWGTAGRKTLGDWITEWLAGAGSRGRSPNTMRLYDALLKGRVMPALGHVALSKLTPAVLERFMHDLEGALSAASVSTLHSVLHVCLVDAERLGVLPVNPLARVRPPTVPASSKIAWDAADARRFLEATEGDADHPLYVLLLTCGLRIGEALALRWSDVDQALGSICVCRTLTNDRAGHGVIGSTTKSGKARTIPCPDMLATSLRTHRQRQRQTRIAHADVWQDRDLVFPNAIGHAQHASAMRDRMRIACQRAGVPPLTPHGLRHTAASLLAEHAPIGVVRDVLGHSSLTITNGYVHSSDASRRGGSNALAGLLTRAE